MMKEEEEASEEARKSHGRVVKWWCRCRVVNRRRPTFAEQTNAKQAAYVGAIRSRLLRTRRQGEEGPAPGALGS